MTFKLLLVLHLIGTAIWVGGHLILCIAILPKALRTGSPQFLTEFESHYEKIGIPALLLQLVTGVWLTHFYVNSFFDIFDFADAQQSLIAVKLMLLAITIIVAAHARLRVIGGRQKVNLPFLAWHILTVTVLGVTILFLGAGVRLGGW